MTTDLDIEQELEASLEKAIDIVKAGRDISDEELHELLADDALLADVLLAKELEAAERAKNNPIDVEQLLTEFHRDHTASPTVAEMPTQRHSLLWTFIGTAAAILVGVVLLLKPSAPIAPTESPTNNIFTADSKQQGVTLTNEQGESIALSPTSAQNSSITLDDFVRVLAKAETERVTLSVPYGKSADITLPDGSVAYLHPNARLVFPTTFTQGKRVVMLEGQAYFKIVHNPDQPFIVVADDMQAKVLGTEFHMDSNKKEVVLVNGCVDVSCNKQQTVLKPRQQVSFQNGQMQVEQVDVTAYEMWRDGYLYFDNVELKDIMTAIGKNFNISVEFHDTAALHCKMRFIAERNKGVEAAIDMMSKMKKANITLEKGRIVVGS